jgi:hypothetical protein
MEPWIGHITGVISRMQANARFEIVWAASDEFANKRFAPFRFSKLISRTDYLS